MNKELGKIQKLIDNFIWIHSGNCEHYHDEYLYMKNFLGFSKLKSFNRNHITKHNETFKEAKRKIISNLKKYKQEELDRISPFIYYYVQENTEPHPLNLSSYLIMLDDEQVSNVIEYWKRLKRNDVYLSLLHRENLEDFCNNHILADALNLINVKDAKLGNYGSPHAYKGEEKIFIKF